MRTPSAPLPDGPNYVSTTPSKTRFSETGTPAKTLTRTPPARAVTTLPSIPATLVPVEVYHAVVERMSKGLEASVYPCAEPGAQTQPRGSARSQRLLYVPSNETTASGEASKLAAKRAKEMVSQQKANKALMAEVPTPFFFLYST